MNKDLLNFFLKLTGFTLLLFAVHFYVFYLFFPETDLYFPLWGIYAFNAVLVFIVYSFISYKTAKRNQKIYNLFLMLTMAKMALAIIFLLPLFVGKSAHQVTEVVNFFIPYFCFLAFEIFSFNKFFKSQQTK